MKQIVRTRIAPSPTGEDLHIGSVYTALYNYVFAQKNQGDFIIRIEDTDRTRFVRGAEVKMLKSLSWVGIAHSEGPDIGGDYGPYRQSERLKVYKQHADKLIKEGRAYYCFCTSERLEQLRKMQAKEHQPSIYDGHCKKIPLTEALLRLAQESYVIRLNVPDSGETVFTDMIRGKIRFQNALIDDQVLIKSDGYPTYHLAVVVDDHLMKISHVIRGEEWISSTPKHVILYWAFGWTLPYFAHLPLLRNPDTSKLSKRRNPVWTSWFRQQGYLPEAIINYLGTLASGMKDGRDKFTLPEMIESFDIKLIKTTAPIFNLEKLTWLNGEYIRELSNSELAKKLKEFMPSETDSKLVQKLIPLAKERMKKLADFLHYLKPFYNYQTIKLDDKDINLCRYFVSVYEHLMVWTAKKLESESKKMIEKESLSIRDALMALRLAVTGEKIGLPLYQTLEILGKDEVLNRLKKFV